MGIVASLVAIVALIAAPGAVAQDEESSYGWAPPREEGDVVSPSCPPGIPPEFCVLGHLGPIPEEAFGEFSSCPDQDEHGIPQVAWCLNFKITGGHLQLGSTTADVDPFTVTVAVHPDSNNEAVIIPGEGGDGGPGSIELPGGLLGTPALDPLAKADPTGLVGEIFSLSVTPKIGEISVGGDSPLDALLWMTGANENDVVIEVPLAIQLHNLLLGETCEIGEFTMNLTNGTAVTPPGVEPMVGSNGPAWHSEWWEAQPETVFDDLGRFAMDIREGSRLVDNGFAVPAASDCGALGVGKTLNDLGLADANVFDILVNDQAGLPSPAGENSAEFTVDVVSALYNSSLGIGTGSWFQESQAEQG